MDVPSDSSSPVNRFRGIRLSLLAFALVLGAGWTSQLQGQTVATPTISPSTNSSYVQFNVTISDSTSGAAIYYTLDGTTPTTSSSSVTSGGTVLISKTETLSAKAFLSGYTASAVATASYTLGQVAAGQYHTLALRTDGSVWAWGYNFNGQIGDNTTNQRSNAVQVQTSNGSGGTMTLPNIVQVGAGAYHSVALDSSHHVWTWGLNSSGQCGDGTTTQRNEAVEVKTNSTTFLSNIVAVAVGGYHNLALDSAGHVWVWGLNGNGQLGDGSTTNQTYAEQLTTTMPGGITVSDLIAGNYHSFLLTNVGTVYGWGDNGSGQVGDGTTTQRTSPVLLTFSGIGTNTITDVSAGGYSTVALASDGTVWTWGANVSGQLGDGGTTNHSSPEHLSSLSNIVAIEAGYTHNFALKNNGTLSLWAWGTDAVGELGDGSSNQQNSPKQISGVSGAVLVTAGNEDSFILKSDGTILGFGANNCQQLGDGLSMYHKNAEPILGLSTPIRQLAGGCYADHALALDSTNTVWSWGTNGVGQLGDGTQLERNSPVQVTFSGLGTATITTVAANGSRSLALDSNATVWSWGAGNLGNSGTASSTVPVHLSGLTGITGIAEGNSWGLAVDSSTHAWSWGANGFGQLGDNTTTARTAPVEVKNAAGTGYLSGVTAVSGGLDHSLALVSGAVYAWGYNNVGQLGNGTTTSSSLPVAVTGLSSVTITAIKAGSELSLALDTSGHVWAWGSNTYGQLGIGNNTSQSSPVEVTTAPGTYLSNVVGITCGNSYCLAVTSSGTVWAWGINAWGQLATGTLTPQQTVAAQTPNVSGVVGVGGGYTNGAALKQDGTLQSWGYNTNGSVGVGANYSIPFTIPGFNVFASLPQPTAAITAPANNATVTLGSSTTFTGSASEAGGTIASVKYYIDSILVGSSTTGSSYNLSWTPPSWGNYTFTALSTDTSGSTSYLSSPITVQVPYDSDGDGLPDWWELKYFGNLGHSASDSPDGNGLTLLQDYQQGNDPTNYYSQNGAIITPTLTIVSGNNQVSAQGYFTSLPLVVGVVNSAGGAALVNAPVTFTATSGGGLVADTTSDTPTHSYLVRTSSSGQAQAYYQQPSGGSSAVSSSITATTATQSVAFAATTSTGDGTFDAPSNLVTTTMSPTEIDLSWVNHATAATGILIQSSTDNSSWTTIATLSSPSATTYAATGLIAGQPYFFRIAGGR